MLDASDEILQIMRDISHTGEMVRLINIYKGYPVSYDARILSVGIDAVTVKVHPYQALCLWLENLTYIQNDKLPEIVRALSITVDLENEIAALSNFDYVSGAPGKRQDARVTLNKVIQVYISLGEHKFRTELRDLSAGGMAVYIDTAYYEPEIFKIDEPLRLSFELPDPDKGVSRTIELIGFIRSVTREHPNRFRIGIQILPSNQEDFVVSRFVDKRQTEVLDEIQTLYTSILSLSTVKEETNNSEEEF